MTTPDPRSFDASESINNLNRSLGGMFEVAGAAQEAAALDESISMRMDELLAPRGMQQHSVPQRYEVRFQQGVSGNDTQPEAARFAHSVIRIAAAKSGVSVGERFAGCSDRNQPQVKTDRFFFVNIPAGQTQAFVEEVDHLRDIVEGNKQLSEQLKLGMELSLNNLNRVEGAKPHVEFSMGEGDDLHLQLRITNTPPALAEHLAKISGQDYETLPNTQRASSRTAEKIVPTGKDITLRLDAPNIDAVAQAIREYTGDHQKRLDAKPRGLGWVRGFLPGAKKPED